MSETLPLRGAVYLLKGNGTEARLPAVMSHEAVKEALRRVLPAPGSTGMLYARTSGALEVLKRAWGIDFGRQIRWGAIQREVIPRGGLKNPLMTFLVPITNVRLLVGLAVLFGAGFLTALGGTAEAQSRNPRPEKKGSNDGKEVGTFLGLIGLITLIVGASGRGGAGGKKPLIAGTIMLVAALALS
ncbi:MAG: hypothetical protein HYY44_08945 [Deltaproteobacteria bacterium]|nr:hypothetical protein [Deltaproteobacteria bacterium]